MYNNVYGSTTHNVKKLEANQIPIDKEMDYRLTLREKIHA